MISLLCHYCKRRRFTGQAVSSVRRSYYEHLEQCRPVHGPIFLPKKPKVIIDGGYFYVTCEAHDSRAEKDGDRVGTRSHVAAMNNAALHYEVQHQTNINSNTNLFRV